VVLAIALILILLGILFLALKGVFGTFPDNFEWIGFIMAGMGMIMASPSIFQMLWGKPLVKTEFEKAVEEDKRCLLVHLQNPPVKNKILQKIGIRRETVQSLTIQFRISEFGSHKIIDPIRHAKIYTDEDPDNVGRYRIALPPTFSVCASFMVILWNTQTNRAFVPPDRLRQSLEISPGYYQIDIILTVDGKPMHILRQFKIGSRADDLIWVKSN